MWVGVLDVEVQNIFSWYSMPLSDYMKNQAKKENSIERPKPVKKVCECKQDKHMPYKDYLVEKPVKKHRRKRKKKRGKK